MCMIIMIMLPIDQSHDKEGSKFTESDDLEGIVFNTMCSYYCRGAWHKALSHA